MATSLVLDLCLGLFHQEVGGNPRRQTLSLDLSFDLFYDTYLCLLLSMSLARVKYQNHLSSHPDIIVE